MAVKAKSYSPTQKNLIFSNGIASVIQFVSRLKKQLIGNACMKKKQGMEWE